MMDLTPLEVRKKKGDFKRQMRGYDPALVDDFLDLVADRLEQVVRENMNLAERAARMDAQITEYRDREKALTEALVSAQQMREEIRRQVEKEAELARREAEADAENIRVTAVQAREREEEAIRRLRARQAQLVQSYRSFLERELAELSVMAETLEVTRTAAPTGSAAVQRPMAKARTTASAPKAGVAPAQAKVPKAEAPSAEMPQHLPPPGPPPEQMPVPLPEPMPAPQPTPMPMPRPVPEPTPAPVPTPVPVAPAAGARREPSAGPAASTASPASVRGTSDAKSESPRQTAGAEPARQQPAPMLDLLRSTVDDPLPLIVMPTAGPAEEVMPLPMLEPVQEFELTIASQSTGELGLDAGLELDPAIENIVEDETDEEEDEGAWVSSLLERKGQ